MRDACVIGTHTIVDSGVCYGHRAEPLNLLRSRKLEDDVLHLSMRPSCQEIARGCNVGNLMGLEKCGQLNLHIFIESTPQLRNPLSIDRPYLDSEFKRVLNYEPGCFVEARFSRPFLRPPICIRRHFAPMFMRN
eukprot:Opistho-2@62367